MRPRDERWSDRVTLSQSAESPVVTSELIPAAVPSTANGTLGRFLLLAVVVAAVGVARYAGWLQMDLATRLTSQHGITAVLLFGVGYAICVVVLLPTIHLNLLAGFLWGPLLGAVAATVSTTVGSVLAFLLARTSLAPVKALAARSSLFVRLRERIEAHPLLALALVRLNPVFPTTVANYALGTMNIPLPTFTWTTLVFLFPGSFVMAFAGYQLGDWTASVATRAAAVRVAAIIGVGPTVILMAAWAISARRDAGKRSAATPTSTPA